MNPPTGEDGEHATFCRLCEAFCGIVATVKDGRVVKVAPDFANPHSRGHVCVKGIAIPEVTYDPDRVLRPLKRVGGPGEFAPISWDEALDDIAERLGRLPPGRPHGGPWLVVHAGLAVRPPRPSSGRVWHARGLVRKLRQCIRPVGRPRPRKVLAGSRSAALGSYVPGDGRCVPTRRPLGRARRSWPTRIGSRA